MKKIPTCELIELMIANKNKFFEISLNNGIFNATHFVRFGGRKLYDTGIDSIEVKWNPDEFQKFYSKAKWVINQVVTN